MTHRLYHRPYDLRASTLLTSVENQTAAKNQGTPFFFALGSGLMTCYVQQHLFIHRHYFLFPMADSP
jgi:hypothetical protein